MLKSIDKNNELNSITSGSKLDGDLTSNGDIRIDGELNGSVKTAGRLVLGDAGTIEGSVNCKSAIIAGELKATIISEELLTLKSTAKLSGEIIAGQLAIEPGAVFSGKCSMGPVIKNINKSDNKISSNAKEKTA